MTKFKPRNRYQKMPSHNVGCLSCNRAKMCLPPKSVSSRIISMKKIIILIFTLMLIVPFVKPSERSSAFIKTEVGKLFRPLLDANLLTKRLGLNYFKLRFFLMRCRGNHFLICYFMLCYSF